MAALTIRKKIFMTTVALILILSIIKVYEIVLLENLESDINVSLNKNWKSLQYSREIEASFYLSNMSITNYIISGDTNWLNIEKESQAQFHQAIVNLRSFTDFPQEYKNTINEIDKYTAEFYKKINQYQNNKSYLEEFIKLNNKKTEQTLYKSKELIAYSQRFIIDNQNSMKVNFNKTKIMAIFTTVVFLFVIIILAITQTKFLLKPLEELLNGIKLIWAGDTEHRIKIDTKDEIGELAKVFNYMASSIHREQKRLVEKATTDEMTGLYNFRYFQEILEKEFEKASRFNRELSFIILDVDFFKFYNDTNGHQAGDQVLKAVAKVVSGSCRDKDIPARYGGEEFVVILPDTPLESASKVAERIRRAVENVPIIYQEKQPNKNLTISLGVSNYPMHAKTSKTLVETADSALYEAKESGKNKVCIAKETTY